MQNPFNVTKAVDFSDQEINDLFVDITERDGFTVLAKPTSPVPMLILGGKGSGKTHLMRYLSFQLQCIRHPGDILSGLSAEGFIGVYLRCGGLNASRFSGKGQSQESWDSLFPYYMDIWMSQLMLSCVREAFRQEKIPPEDEALLAQDITDLFDTPPSVKPNSLVEVCELLRHLQKEIDREVNNCAIKGRLDVEIRTSPGTLVFGIPDILRQRISALADLVFLYLFDELENLDARQQQYVQTLIREKRPPATIKIGARLYGIKTYATYSAGEENKEGSEFETLWLDSQLRGKKTGIYASFSRRLCTRRLQEFGYAVSTGTDASDGRRSMDDFFFVPDRDEFLESQTHFIRKKYANGERPYFRKVRDKLFAAIERDVVPGVENGDDIIRIIDCLRCVEFPILEKVNLLLLYQDWSSGKNVAESAMTIAQDCQRFREGENGESRYLTAYQHFKDDLLAQLFRESGRRLEYCGFERFVTMSGGLPRNLLIILKHIFKASTFNGEAPFEEGVISSLSQQEGVREAAEWFFRDAKMAGKDGDFVRSSIARLATLFRDIRYSDKPSECSIVTFSGDIYGATKTSQRNIQLAEQLSLLIRISKGQKDRNTRRIDNKYQLSPMLAPFWELPVSRRGTISLTAKELNSIFDPDFTDSFESLSRARVSRMQAPYFGKNANGNKSTSHGKQPKLPGFEE